MNEKKGFNAKKFALLLIIIFLIIILIICVLMKKSFTSIIKDISLKVFQNEEIIERENEIISNNSENIINNNDLVNDEIKNNELSKFDFCFLKLENDKKNKIYSPLSIKFALKMLEDASTGESKNQISNLINNYKFAEYNSTKNMAFANAFFIRNSYKENIKQSYIDLIKNKYNAEIVFDNFSTSKNINNWVKENTLGLIDELFSDEDVSDMEFSLINALGIDMEWKHKFLEYYYEDDNNITSNVEYKHEKVYWSTMETLYKLNFDKNQTVSGMEVTATLNNYDIVKELGEEKIKETVKNAFTEWAKTSEATEDFKEYFNNDFSANGINKAFEKYWNEGNYGYDGKQIGYLQEIKENYRNVDYSTDFSIYVDDNVKVFSKDLKEYDGTTLQYIGIMPIKDDLDIFIENTSETDIQNLLSNLKELKLENFKDGVLTKISGYIPKFKFDYELGLQQDLNKLGVTDVFEENKANLSNLTEIENIFIGKIAHKANIEFTQDGIKAAAATGAGGMGAGGFFDYCFDVPTEKIDITFNKPYIFIIKDKENGETWFVGTVYEPLKAEDEPGEITEIYEYNE